MNEIIPGVFRIKLPLPLRDTYLGYNNAYLVRGDSGCLMVDTGWDTEEAFESLKKQLGEIGLGLKDIKSIVVTHMHPDHFGLVRRIKKAVPVDMLVHRLENTLIASGMDLESRMKESREWLHRNGVGNSESAWVEKASAEFVHRFIAPIPPDGILEDGQEIPVGQFKLRVVWSPGHSPGQVCLYEPAKRILFSGDHILPHITPNIGLNPQASANPLGDFLSSLNDIKRMDVSLILPGHEEPFTDLPARIEVLFHHHNQRIENILKALDDETKTAFEIAVKIPWLLDEGGAGWQDLNPLNKRLAMLETLAHLELICRQGKINRLSRNGCIYFQRNGK